MQTFYFELMPIHEKKLTYKNQERFVVFANSLQSALIKLSKNTSFNFRKNKDNVRVNGDYYKAKGANKGLVQTWIYNPPENWWLEKAKVL